MNRAFTLIELLVVVAIMGLLGTASVGGYRQMQRGMEERGVIQNVNTFIDNAFRRAQIDRQPTAVYFWNELVRAESEDENAVVVGKAVAVRRNGRISKIDNSSAGTLLVDEFGDLNLTYPGDRNLGSGADSSGSESAQMDVSSKAAKMRLYNMTTPTDGMKYSLVYDMVASTDPRQEVYLTHDATQSTFDPLSPANGGKGSLVLYGFVDAGGGNANWAIGDAYGMEFGTLELPRGYVFGTSIPTDLSNPTKVLDDSAIVFRPSGAVGRSTVQISSMRPNASGQLSVQKVGTTDSPRTGD